MFHGLAARPTPDGNVDWDLAQRVALEQAAEGDRAPSPEESARIEQALALAEHWLDTTGLPAASDAGRLVVASRQDWTRAALDALRPLVEPVAGASVRALSALAREQLGDLDVDDLSNLGLDLPEGIEPMLRGLFDSNVDLGEMLRPAAAMLTGLQVGQVVGALSRQVLGQYDLGVPTAPRGHAHQLPVNIEEAFGEWDLDPMDVAMVLIVHEAALRRLFHAVEWLEGHLHGLVGEFAAGTRVDRDRLDALSHELMTGVDPDDPDALRAAMEHAANFRLEPTDAQRRVLQRLQAVIALTTAWARSEGRNALGDRIPSRERIDEVLRRRRATRGDGEALLANLLGLDLRPTDESIAEAFVATVTEVLGSQGLHRALAHPENLPDTEELADPMA
ncbi:MAG: zinc-dependent metalloprotease, partial [Nitriliruptoraceae bacterium]